MKPMTFLALLLINLSAAGQQQTFDIISFDAPKGWEQKQIPGTLTFTKTYLVTDTWCQISMLKSVASKGSLDADFASDWESLATKALNITEAPQTTQVQEADGWKTKSGVAKFRFQNQDAVAMLTTITGYGVYVSIFATTNSDEFLTPIDKLLSSVELKKPTVTATNTNKNGNSTAAGNNAGTNNNPGSKKPAPANQPFQFTITNFDDGWVAVAKDDWVEATRDRVIVRLHYPNPAAVIAADPDPAARHAWNLLVAPRYSNLENFRVVSPSLDWQRATLATATVTNQKQQQVFVALFQKGNSDWLEVEVSDKADFVKMFGFDPDKVGWDASSSLWKPLLQLFNLNKFAVAASDLSGSWSSDFSGALQMYSAVSGRYMGMNTHQSNESFVFGPGNTYSWKLLVISGAAGSSKFNNVASKGTYTMPNDWQISFSDIEGKPKTYDVAFGCIKGGRVLWMRPAGSDSPSKPFGQAK